MKMKKLLVPFLVLVLAACATQPTLPPTPQPTYTSYPTYTPVPTYTPYPTQTLLPTYTPVPTATVQPGKYNKVGDVFIGNGFIHNTEIDNSMYGVCTGYENNDLEINAFDCADGRVVILVTLIGSTDTQAQGHTMGNLIVEIYGEDVYPGIARILNSLTGSSDKVISGISDGHKVFVETNGTFETIMIFPVLP